MRETLVRLPIEGTIGTRSVGPALPESVAQPASMIVTVDGAMRQALDQAQTRLLVVGLLFALALLVVTGRLADLALFGTHGGAGGSHIAPPPAQIVRADIVDRNGVVLATSIPTASLVVDRTHIIDAADAALQLSKLFPNIGYGELLQRMQGKERFVYLRRHLTPPQQYAVNQLGIPGLEFHPDERRVYTPGNEAVHLVG
jgi:cell division protein FtsI (penicillin-binding protein 3)